VIFRDDYGIRLRSLLRGSVPGHGRRCDLLAHSARDVDWRNEAENATAANAGIGSDFAVRKCWFLGLLGSFGLLTLEKAHARAAAVLVDEFDACALKGLLQDNQGCTSRAG